MTNQAVKKQLPAWLVLTIISLVAALALAATNAVTAGPIREHAQKAQREAFGAVLTADEYTEITMPEGHAVTTLVEAKTGGKTVGYCVAASEGGYAGPVAVTLGIDTEGKITGAKIGDNSFVETNGFGSRWLAENKAGEFKGIDVTAGGSIEALSGATVTSTAVLKAANAGIDCVKAVMGMDTSAPALAFGVVEKAPVEQPTLTGDIHEGSFRGFDSDVRVQLTMDDAGVITGLVIDSSGETPSFGTRCMEEPDFAKQFIGKTAPVKLGDGIDALAGATVTSTAVVEAVNAAAAAPANPDAVPFGSEQPAEEPAVEASAPVAEGALTGKAPGYDGGEVTVTVTLNADNTVAALTVDASTQTPGLGTKCADEAFTKQFIGKTAPFELGNGIDAVSHATVTSQAVVDALNSVFPTQDMAETSAEPVATELTGKAPGYDGGEVTVTVTLNADNTVAALTVDASTQTPGLGTKCADEAFTKQFIGKTAPFELGNGIDAVSHATVTSQAVVDALNSVVPAGEAAPAEEAAAALTGKAAGYDGGEVTVTVTLNADNTVAALTVDASTQTPGLGTKCADEAFTKQFIGKTAPFELGNGIDAVSHATVTSKAVVDAVNSVFPTQDMAETSAEPVATELTGKAAGYDGGEVTVTVTLNADNTVATLTVDASTQTPGLGTKCADEAFTKQFIGKTAPFELGNGIDAVSHATVTSQAVVDALNSVVPAGEAAPAEEAAALTGKAAGYDGGEVTVTVTLNADNTVATLTVDASTQTPGLGTKCADEAFTKQFIGKTAPFELGNGIDAVSHATVTSKAVVDAVNSVFPTQDMAETSAEPVATELTGKAAGYDGGEVTVTVTLNADNTVATLTVDASTQTPGLGTKCADEAFTKQFIGKTAPFELGNGIDAVSHATVTSKAVVDAVNSAVAQ